jgi:RNA polymerase sigma-70 factor (ECF subfamily)
LKTDKNSDTHLVIAFQSGNANALTELVKRWHKRFCEKAFWMVKDADAAKDIAQDSWKTIMNKIHDLKEPSSFSSWAMRIVYTKSLDAIRETNRKRQKQENLANLANERIIETEGYEENTQLKIELLKAIRSLSDHHQMVLKLFYVEDYSLKEISATLNISIGTAKSRLFHAREHLKLILKK